MAFPSEYFFAKVYQYSSITNFTLPPQSFFIGIPCLIEVVVASTPSNAAEALNLYNPTIYNTINQVPGAIDVLKTKTLTPGCTQKIGLWGTDNSKDIKFQKEDNSLLITNSPPPNSNLNVNKKVFMMYTNHGYFKFKQKLYYFSTLNNGIDLYGSLPRIRAVNGSPSIQAIPVTYKFPTSDNVYSVYRYFTSLKYNNVNLNEVSTVTLGWSSTDITGSYGNDPATVKICKEDGTVIVSLNIINDTTIPINILNQIPSGRYYYVYDFLTLRLENLGRIDYPDTSGNDSLQKTPTFTFITKHPESITVTNADGNNDLFIITLNIGVGYLYYKYDLEINGVLIENISFPYYYQAVSAVTTTYTVTISGSEDTTDQGSLTTTFIHYKYIKITDIFITLRIIESSYNYILFEGGSSITQQFQYGTTSITNMDGSINFISGDRLKTTGFFTKGVAYFIQPTNINENSGTYGPFYFDSIAPNQGVRITSDLNSRKYIITWNAHYNLNRLAPDGTREYDVTIFSNDNSFRYETKSTYNVITIPVTTVSNDILYRIEVEDIVVATNVSFFQTPTNFSITPGYINFYNTILWAEASNNVFDVYIGNNYKITTRAPYSDYLTEDIIDLVGKVSFGLPNTLPKSAIVTDTYSLSAKTINITLPRTSFPIFQGFVFTYNIGPFLYNDTYSLSLYRNGAVVQQLEANITTLTAPSFGSLPDGPVDFPRVMTYTWFPAKYVVNYQRDDQIYVKSNQHLNYGISQSFRFTVNASVSLFPSGSLKKSYIFFSTILAVMTIDSVEAFTVQLQNTIDSDSPPPPIPVTFTLDDKKYSIYLNYAIPIGNYRLDFLLVNSPTIIVSSPNFEFTTDVKMDKEKYNIDSNVNATVNVGVPTTFEVELQDTAGRFQAIPLGDFNADANLLTYSFKFKGLEANFGNYVLKFTANSILVTSPPFLFTADVIMDKPEYTIISTVNASLYTEVPTTFTVVLQDKAGRFQAITLDDLNTNANSLYTYSVKLYGLAVTDGNYELKFTSISIILTSPPFLIIMSYFKLVNPVITSAVVVRDTSNSLCVTTKKNNIPTTIISIVNNVAYPNAITGKPQFLVPCAILNHLKELTKLLTTMTLRNALLFLIQKYDIPQSTKASSNKPRYQYTPLNTKVIPPILQYSASFRLGDFIGGRETFTESLNPLFKVKLTDARILSLCNDDAKTFSSLYTDMLVKATYWLSTIPPIAYDGAYIYCVVRPLQGTLKQIIAASITLIDNQLIFTPIILRSVLGFYEPYRAIDITILYSSITLEDIFKYLTGAFDKIFLDPTTAL